MATAGGKGVVRESFRIAPQGETREIELGESKAPPERRLTKAALGLLGASAVVGVISTALGIASVSLDESVEGCDYERGRCSTEDQLADAKAAQNAALGLSWAATVGLPLGAVGTLIGLLLPHEDAPTPEVVFVPGGLVTGLSLRF